MTRTPVDVVDRVKPNPKHGTTWHSTEARLALLR